MSAAAINTDPSFWSSYLVTISGVVTTGVAAVALRFLWRWWTAPEPRLVRLQIIGDEVRAINQGDFVVHLTSTELLAPPEPGAWRIDHDKPFRLAPGRFTGTRMSQKDPTIPWVVGNATPLDRHYRIGLRDDNHAHWYATYAPGAQFNTDDGQSPSDIHRVWKPEPLGWLVAQWQLSRQLLSNQRNRT